MNKKLLAVAVAGALAVPTLAFAQSSVTISGVLKVGVDNLSISNPAAPSRNGKNTSEMRVTDNSSRIIFNMVEDLGSGLAAIGQIDVRFSTDIAANGPATAPTNVGGTTMSAGGNTWVGLRSKTAGTVVIGRQDLHYGLFELNELAAKAGALMGVGVGLFDFTAAGVAIAGGTRTNNVVMYDSPNWGGFDIRAAWSSNPTGTEADLSPNGTTNGLTTRKGNAWNFNPKFTAGNWGARWSHWEQKSDGGSNPSSPQSFVACTAAQTAAGSIALLGGCASGVTNPADQRGDTLLGWMSFGGLKVALGWNKSRLTGTDITNGGAGVITANRVAWTVPINYTFGPNTIYFHYTKANNDTATAVTDGARMWALAYVYELSKRTSVGVTYAKITNDTGAAYNFFTNASNTQFGSQGSASLAGEKPQLISLIARHAF